jgi:cbb3-type cytochrome oxidase cytochrome c subunit
MRGIAPLFLGIFGTFAFSWAGLTFVPNLQIGHLDPQMDEDGTDVYPAPKSGMANRGRRVYAANGCGYCHSQQVRADYAASDIDRKWGDRRSAPRDYLFERPVLLGKMRMGPDLSNIGKRAPAEDQNAAPAGTNPAAGSLPPGPPAATGSSAAPAASPAGNPPGPAAPAGSPAGSPPKSNPPAPAAASPAPPAGSPPPRTAAVGSATGSPAKSNPPAAAAAGPTAPATSPAGIPPAPAAAVGSPAGSLAKTNPPAASGNSPAAPSPAVAAANATPNPANSASSAATVADATASANGAPIAYTATWHHLHLYSPRSITVDSNMPAYRFLYERRRISGEKAADALQLTGADAPPEGWEVVPTYEAKTLVAYLMSLDQSHPLKEVKMVAAPAAASSPAGAASPAAGKEAK